MYCLLETVMHVGDKLMRRQIDICSYEAYNSSGGKKCDLRKLSSVELGQSHKRRLVLYLEF